jgi:sulfur transfer complex TusBCD TusB component (DsrH family)
MQRIDPIFKIYASETSRNYLQVLKDNKTFERMVDAYLFAAAFALKEDLSSHGITISNRGDLIAVSQIDQEVILALTAGIYIICKKNSYPEPTNGQEVLDMICQYAEVGLRELKERWQGKVSNQIQTDIQKIIDNSKTPF